MLNYTMIMQWAKFRVCSILRQMTPFLQQKNNKENQRESTELQIKILKETY